MPYPRLSDRMKQQNAFVETKLGSDVICNQCGATLATYADVCSADLSDPCPGFQTLEGAISEFNQRRPTLSEIEIAALCGGKKAKKRLGRS